MKRMVACILAAMLAAFLTGCGGSAGGKMDIDLTQMSSTMVFAEVNHMMLYPEDYKGKNVRMYGTFSYYQDEKTQRDYYSCYITDAAACCAQGVEFVLKDAVYPDDYPKEDQEIIVRGVFDVYEEFGYPYGFLRDAVLE